MSKVQHVFIVGSKSFGAYGGYETFVDKLTEYHQNNEKIKYHVACKANGSGSRDESKLVGATKINDEEFIYHNAHCFKIKIPERMGAEQAIYYDVKALEKCCEIIEKEKIENAIVYILACRIGIIIRKYYKKLHKFGARLYINPDGHEWKRAKWKAPVRLYWKWSERMMIKYSDFVICDSKNIEKYVHDQYDKKGLKRSNPKTTFIAYGAKLRKSILKDDDPQYTEWLAQRGLKPGEYYLVVGRFVPENNYETMIKEFLRSESKKKFAIVTNIDSDILEKLENDLHFIEDGRVRFVGTVYDQELLMKIREKAYAYLHGHSVGGTNPSLLESMGSETLNLLFDVGFNREVAEDTAFYWTKEDYNLANLINKVDKMDLEEVKEKGRKAGERIKEYYSWESISDSYEEIFFNYSE
ncbi:MAG: DUF1972 domain-containing protein [Lachnospiraceae bacterium]|nr:DUF1972 domain-containing protein [Lachnospiraceae bacterium]